MGPLPLATAETRPFWDGCANGELRYQRCADCGSVQFIPRWLCAACQSRALEWKNSRRLGHILSHTTVYRAPTPAFRGNVPYVIALVDLDEGFRLMVNIKVGDSAAVAIGGRVRIGFREVDGGALPEAEMTE